MKKEHKQFNVTPADRVSSVKEYYFSTKLKEIATMNQAGKDIINLGIGKPDMPPSQATLATMCKETNEPTNHGYQPYRGIVELRQGFANWYQRIYAIDLNPETEIQPLIGSKEGVLYISLAFLNPGDKVLLPNPGYPTYSSVTKLVGAEAVYYNLKEEEGWLPNFEEIEKEDLDKIKLMWVNYPNMPTGTNASVTLFEQLVAFGQKHNIIICNDNPYSMICNTTPLSILSIPDAKSCCIELNSMSKSHNMSGWRVGMCASNATFIQWILKVKSNIDSGTYRPLQLAAAKALENSDEWHQKMNIDVYEERKQVAYEIIDLLNCTIDKSQVGMFLWAKIPNSYKDAGELSDEILYKSNVFITPGFIFGDNGKRYIRISLCTNKEKLQKAINRIKKLNNK